ncbi:glycoside hydrolase family 3 C-terminal domain-containing protein [Aerococcaceae bacterium zg-BR9]|uniref:glycoside hydrolase family 3 N-terminal domain-containing protein n=1 Tax=Aerococcaceae bacterium zg-1292 TaxID=2774330 RepID=UPI004062C7BE|nr:glycoside hydrolase family 3 C-terminal domain-containing protein [Aerococcaceae bacterium zg-BR9]
MEQEQLLALLQKMTLEEKIGQMVQLTPTFFSEDGEITGPMLEMGLNFEQLNSIGTVLGTHTKEEVINIQKNYLAQSRLKIPLMFMADVIHGYETIFPIPLAMASSFNPELVEKMAHLSAKEASAAGIHVTFSPMADLVRDARWGRVLESNGEDSYLSSKMTESYVKGYQGEGLINKQNIAACVKHFVGYGESQGGKDYNTVDISDVVLFQDHLPSFKAAIDAGAKLVMSSFNIFRGVPVTANRYLLTDVLRDKLNFEGIIISDWAAISELVQHRVADSKYSASKKAFEAGVEIDMMTDFYLHALPELVKSGEISEQKIDETVMRILELKNELGLFEDPYRGLMDQLSYEEDLRVESRSIATETLVLLKNQESILPIKPTDKIGLAGSKVNSRDTLGAWSWLGKIDESISIAEAFKDSELIIDVAEQIVDFDRFQTVDKVIIAVGETGSEAGEAASKTNLKLTLQDIETIKQIHQWNQNIILVVYAGRPLDLTDVEPFAKAILYAWFPGSQAGNAIVDVLTGRVNPSAKLAMSLPRSVGQMPLHYNHYSTGRPFNDNNPTIRYMSRYLDVIEGPLYSFGHGLNYSEIELSAAKIINGVDSLTINYTLTNHSDIDGQEVVQLYIRDCASEVVRPVRELKHFEKVSVDAHSTYQGSFDVQLVDLAYVHSDLTRYADSGTFELFLGLDSYAPKLGEWEYKG